MWRPPWPEIDAQNRGCTVHLFTREQWLRGDFDSPLYRRVVPADPISAGVKLRSALEKCYHELNIIRARDGVPYTHYGKSDVDENYFSSVVDSAREALEATK